MYVVARGIDQGYRAAVFSSLGLSLGDLLQVVCAAVGLSALLASSVVFFAIAKYAGAAYLIFLGVRRLLEKNALVLPTSAGGEHTPRRIPSRSLIIQGFLALNPKTALFFLALFPQFVTPNAGPAWLQILFFGCGFRRSWLHHKLALWMPRWKPAWLPGETQQSLSKCDSFCQRGNPDCLGRRSGPSAHVARSSLNSFHIQRRRLESSYLGSLHSAPMKRNRR